MTDLAQRRDKMHVTGVVAPVERKVTRWQIIRGKFFWPHYVCHATDCHCNCHTSELFSPFASLWCYFNGSACCPICSHQYQMHRVSCHGWDSREDIEHVELGEDLVQAAQKEASKQKALLAQQIDQTLDEYSNLGLRNAYTHLLRSQRAVLEERLAANPDDSTSKTFLRVLVKNIEEIEKAAESTCCICFEQLADTAQLRAQAILLFLQPGLWHLPLCRQIVTSRKLTSPLASTAAT